MDDVGTAIRAALEARAPRDKVMLTRRVARDWRLGRLAFAFEAAMPEVPGRPDRPELLPPGRMPKRGKAQSERGRIALFHALAHIEFVAIDLALDMAGRFGAEMGPAFVGDFLATAADEAMHFALLDRHLATMGARYGDLPAHGGLWTAAHDTRDDVAARLAVVPMVLEARGLDVTPGTIDRVLASGDARGARILERILVDEIRHVGLGTSHFVALAKTRGIPPESLWRDLVSVHFRGRLKPPFNDSARRRAGLSRDFYAGLAC
ncbi:ferritin-like domain-containing protein [Novosphingobium aquimarinum]|uniref:ferritin-like domain-containing protein n=1 Tax=Novosphingobium aquimarinum TaxID=2682494 RepID=UPI0012EC5663|nr:ferritin-like domain-containing protein [Novosphingobium aquimarinum]